MRSSLRIGRRRQRMGKDLSPAEAEGLLGVPKIEFYRSKDSAQNPRERFVTGQYH